MLSGRNESQQVLAALKQHGLLLQSDARLPNVCALVTGAPVRGSWWAHPRSHDIFRVNCDLAEHPDVVVLKLISGKITYVYRSLWPHIVAIGRSRAAWQLEGLSPTALDLLEEVDRAPALTDRRLAKPATELEKVLLVASEQAHTAAGYHVRRLESWPQWERRKGLTLPRLNVDDAIDALEQVMDLHQRRFQARGRLPLAALTSGCYALKKFPGLSRAFRPGELARALPSGFAELQP